MDIISIIKQIQSSKQQAHIEPSNATFKEIMEEISKDVKSQLNNYVKDGTLEFHRTLNDISFNIK